MTDRKKHFARPTTSRPPSLVNLTLWTVILAVAAGFAGYLLAKSVLPINEANYFGIVGNQGEISIDLEQPLINVALKSQKSIAGIYRPVQALNAVGQPLFTNVDFLGSAVVVTSDGWLMTTDQVIKDTSHQVILGDEVYAIKEISRDEFTGVVFIKIEANFLQPVGFQLTDDIKTGERLLANIDSPHSVNHIFYTGLLTDNHYVTGKYLQTDKVDYYLQIADISQAKAATPYFNMDSDLLGLTYQMDDQTVLLPAEYLKQSVKHLLNKTERVLLGIRYVDMENNSGFVRKGNLVFHPNLSPIAYTSPAYQAGLKSGDQIVAINNDIISEGRTLTSILQNYRLGDIVIMKISRDGLEQDLEIQL